MARRRQPGNALTTAAGGYTIRVEGLAALQRDLNKVNKTAKAEVRDGLKEVAKPAVKSAKNVARAKGLYDTGELIRKISPAITQQGVFIRAKATRSGFAYPAIYEFGGRDVQLTRRGVSRVRNRSARGQFLRTNYGGATGEFGEYGPRAFLYPGVMDAMPQIVAGLERWLDTFLVKNDL
jgi:phage gpG-like protein